MRAGKRGLTLIEAMTAASVMAIAVASFYVAFTAVVRYSHAHRNESEAYGHARRWLEEVRARRSYNEMALVTNRSINNASSVLQEDFTAWDLNSRVDNLDATYTISDVSLDAVSEPYKKISIRITWDERT